jgi:hypothetical protein
MRFVWPSNRVPVLGVAADAEHVSALGAAARLHYFHCPACDHLWTVAADEPLPTDPVAGNDDFVAETGYPITDRVCFIRDNPYTARATAL